MINLLRSSLMKRRARRRRRPIEEGEEAAVEVEEVEEEVEEEAAMAAKALNEPTEVEAIKDRIPPNQKEMTNSKISRKLRIKISGAEGTAEEAEEEVLEEIEEEKAVVEAEEDLEEREDSGAREEARTRLRLKMVTLKLLKKLVATPNRRLLNESKTKSFSCFKLMQ